MKVKKKKVDITKETKPINSTKKKWHTYLRAKKQIKMQNGRQKDPKMRKNYQVMKK